MDDLIFALLGCIGATIVVMICLIAYLKFIDK